MLKPSSDCCLVRHVSVKYAPSLLRAVFCAKLPLPLPLLPSPQSIGTTDMNPMNSSLLSSSDAVVSVKMLILKIIFVVVSTMLDELGNIQAGFMAAAMFGVVYYLIDGVSEPK